jgi:ubiquinone/menaquinone biosynthesis C-methylase UbiE
MSVAESVSADMEAFLPVLICPICSGRPIEAVEQGLQCGKCGRRFERREDLQLMCDEQTERMAFATDFGAFGPSPTQQDVVTANALYHNHAAESYEEDNHAIGTITDGGNLRLREVFEHLRAKGATGPMLDFGTGTGHLLTLAEGMFYPRVGIDVSSGMLRRARRKGLPVLVANALNPPVADASIGLATSYSFLHHFKQPKEVLSQMVRALRPGGWLVADWEPNRFGRPRALSLLAADLKHPKLWFRKPAYRASTELQRLNEIAEYHEALRPGLDPDEIGAYLRSLGMRANIVFHSNGRSAYKPSFRIQDRIRAVLDGRRPNERHCSVYFMIIAQRLAA